MNISVYTVLLVCVWLSCMSLLVSACKREREREEVCVERERGVNDVNTLCMTSEIVEDRMETGREREREGEKERESEKERE